MSKKSENVQLKRISGIPRHRGACQKGFPEKTSKNLKGLLKLTNKELAKISGISVSTIIRHKRSKTPMSPVASDRLHRLARIFAEAVEVMGDVDSARTWMHRPHAIFGGRSPIERMEKDIGVEEVETVLVRLRHGVIG